MKHHRVIINAVVSVRVANIEADNPDEAAGKALLAVESQLDHIFDRKISDNIETFFSDDIPAIMVDTIGPNHQDGDEPIATHWVRCDIPLDDLTVYAALEDTLRTFKQGNDNAFASEDLKGKMELLALAYSRLPKQLVRTAKVVDGEYAEVEGSAV